MAKKEAEVLKEEKTTCGLIMPISTIDGCSIEHWVDVRTILTEAIENAGFKANLVSDSDDSGVIQKRIVQNIYDNEIIVCDVSCKNPNVMFELGMRLAFDKPTIIVMDDKTAYSFDTSIIEHISYPRDLRYQAILDFKERLREKIKGTLKASRENSNYSTFLKHFGEFQVAQIENKEGSINDVVLSMLYDMSYQISRIRQQNKASSIKDRFFTSPHLSEEKGKSRREIIRKHIDIYCEEHNIDISSLFNNEKEKEKIYAYFKKYEVMDYLRCNTSELRQLIDDIISDF